MPKNYEGFITCSARQKYFLLVSIFLTFLTLVVMKTQCVGDKLLLFVFLLDKQENGSRLIFLNQISLPSVFISDKQENRTRLIFLKYKVQP